MNFKHVLWIHVYWLTTTLTRTEIHYDPLWFNLLFAWLARLGSLDNFWWLYLIINMQCHLLYKKFNNLIPFYSWKVESQAYYSDIYTGHLFPPSHFFSTCISNLRTLKTFGSILEHSETPWSTLEHSKPFWNTFFLHFGVLFYSLPRLEHSDSLRITSIHFDLLWNTLKQSVQFWNILEHSETLWYSLEHFHLLWNYRRPTMIGSFLSTFEFALEHIYF